MSTQALVRCRLPQRRVSFPPQLRRVSGRRCGSGPRARCAFRSPSRLRWRAEGAGMATPPKVNQAGPVPDEPTRLMEEGRAVIAPIVATTATGGPAAALIGARGIDALH